MWKEKLHLQRWMNEICTTVNGSKAWSLISYVYESKGAETAVVSAQRGQLTVYLHGASLMWCQSGGISVNVRKSSFSTLIQQQWRIPGMEMMGAVEWRGGESHTCRMICHYRGGSALSCHPLITQPTLQVSPPLLPKLHSSPPKTPPAFLSQLRFHSEPCCPICPSFLHSTLRENVPLWEKQHTEHIVWTCNTCFLPCVCLHSSRASPYVCLTAELLVLITEGRP